MQAFESRYLFRNPSQLHAGVVKKRNVATGSIGKGSYRIGGEERQNFYGFELLLRNVSTRAAYENGD
jgi:hypothetical protein